MVDTAGLKRLTRTDDPDFKAFARLFVRIIDAKYRFDPRKILEWVAESLEDRENCGWESYLFLLKAKGDVAGFIYFEYFKADKILFVSWIGMDPALAQAGKYTAGVFFTLLDQILRTELTPCEAVITEIATPRAEVSVRDKARRSALALLVRFFAGQAGRRFYRLDIPYVQPVPDPDRSSGYAEEEMDLLYMPVTCQPDPETLSRDTAIRILRLLCLEVYQAETEACPEAKQKEYTYMKALLDRQTHGLPAQIKLIPL